MSTRTGNVALAAVFWFKRRQDTHSGTVTLTPAQLAPFHPFTVDCAARERTLSHLCHITLHVDAFEAEWTISKEYSGGEVIKVTEIESEALPELRIRLSSW